MYKQAILIRADLKLPKGKLAVQAAHASVENVLRMLNDDKQARETVKAWRKEGMKKSVLKVQDDKELFLYKESAKAKGIYASIITDAGKTVVEPGTVTCLALGPDEEEKIDELAGKLKLI
ncbi:MAG TPA: peptidyl-tRNA hydrolase [Candidatus Woesearchaeota archaeon]|nr:peptidyl-tRNA hydrolase [Candidatus Woesearchaeota archaeon]